jgi:hypothetical protein
MSEYTEAIDSLHYCVCDAHQKSEMARKTRTISLNKEVYLSHQGNNNKGSKSRPSMETIWDGEVRTTRPGERTGTNE